VQGRSSLCQPSGHWCCSQPAIIGTGTSFLTTIRYSWEWMVTFFYNYVPETYKWNLCAGGAWNVQTPFFDHESPYLGTDRHHPPSRMCLMYSLVHQVSLCPQSEYWFHCSQAVISDVHFINNDVMMTTMMMTVTTRMVLSTSSSRVHKEKWWQKLKFKYDWKKKEKLYAHIGYVEEKSPESICSHLECQMMCYHCKYHELCMQQSMSLTLLTS
jgi:hypothetical protein